MQNKDNYNPPLPLDGITEHSGVFVPVPADPPVGIRRE